VQGDGVGPDPFDVGAEGDEEMGKLLDVRLGIRIVVPSAPTAAIKAFSVPVTLGSSRKTSTPMSLSALNSNSWSMATDAPSCSNARTCIHPSSSDDISARRRQLNSPRTGEQRPRQKDRCTDLRTELRVKVRAANGFRAYFEGVGRFPADRDPKRSYELDE
jgi:hypothetical protein